MADDFTHLNRIAALAWLIVTLLMILGALAPFRFEARWEFAARNLAKVHLNPLISPETGRRVSVPDVAQNILLFVPFGALGVLSLRQTQGATRATTALRTVRVVAAATLMSASFEAAQLFTAYRTSSLTDVIANVLGALAGAALCTRLLWWWNNHPRQAATVRSLTATPGFSSFAMIGVLLCVAAWQPFDATLDVTSVLEHLRAMRSYEYPLWNVGALLTEAIRGVLFGFVSAQWLARAGVRNAARWAVLLGVLMAAGLESIQVFIESRTPSLFDAMLIAVMTMAGAALLSRFTSQMSRRVLGAALATVTLAAGALQLQAPVPHSSMAALIRPFDATVLAAQFVFCLIVLSGPA
jgi:glycopeptide antibiotics resistance protein